jgi:hypothetical protein
MDMRVGEVGSGDEGYVRSDEDERNESLIFMNVCDVGVVWLEMHVNAYVYVANEVSRVRLVMARRRWVYKALVFLVSCLSSLSHTRSCFQFKYGQSHGSWRLCGDFSKNVRLQRHMSVWTSLEKERERARISKMIMLARHVFFARTRRESCDFIAKLIARKET